MAEGYNGWSNYETWAVALWLGNDPYTEAESRRIAQKGETYEASKELKEWVLEANPMLDMNGKCSDSGIDYGLFSDLLTSALSEVNWYEIVENFSEE